jgi:hypothetical protein
MSAETGDLVGDALPPDFIEFLLNPAGMPQ